MHQCPPTWLRHWCSSPVGWTVETRPKPSFQISLTCQVSTKRVKGVEIQSLVQYWINTVCCRSKNHFHWTAPLYPPVPRWSQKWGGGHWPPTPPGCAAHDRQSLWKAEFFCLPECVQQGKIGITFALQTVVWAKVAASYAGMRQKAGCCGLSIM